MGSRPNLVKHYQSHERQGLDTLLWVMKLKDN